MLSLRNIVHSLCWRDCQCGHISNSATHPTPRIPCVVQTNLLRRVSRPFAKNARSPTAAAVGFLLFRFLQKNGDPFDWGFTSQSNFFARSADRDPPSRNEKTFRYMNHSVVISTISQSESFMSLSRQRSSAAVVSSEVRQGMPRSTVSRRSLTSSCEGLRPGDEVQTR